jgi:hypothetical protein
MSLRPRHYILLAIVLGLFVWNIIRYHHVKSDQQGIPAAPAPVVNTAARVNTPAWTAFDQAVDLRDAPDGQFLPAMKELQAKIDAAPADASTSDVKGCLTWLQFYRQGAKHPGADTTWKTRSERHLNGCVQFHLDTTAQ